MNDYSLERPMAHEVAKERRANRRQLNAQVFLMYARYESWPAIADVKNVSGPSTFR